MYLFNSCSQNLDTFYQNSITLIRLQVAGTVGQCAYILCKEDVFRRFVHQTIYFYYCLSSDTELIINHIITSPTVYNNKKKKTVITNNRRKKRMDRYFIQLAINFRANSRRSYLCQVKQKWYKSKTGSTYGYYFMFRAIFLNGRVHLSGNID